MTKLRTPDSLVHDYRMPPSYMGRSRLALSGGRLLAAGAFEGAAHDPYIAKHGVGLLVDEVEPPVATERALLSVFAGLRRSFERGNTAFKIRDLGRQCPELLPPLQPVQSGKNVGHYRHG